MSNVIHVLNQSVWNVSVNWINVHFVVNFITQKIQLMKYLRDANESID